MNKNLAIIKKIYIALLLTIALICPVGARDSDTLSIEHILMLDVSGSMSNYRSEWGQYGDYENGFSSNVVQFLETLLATDGKILRDDSPIAIYPCSFYGRRDGERVARYRQVTENLCLSELPKILEAREQNGQAKLPGPSDDGAMGEEGMLTALKGAMAEASERNRAPIRFYWFLTDNGFGDSKEKLPESFYRFLTSQGEPSFAKVWFAPLRKIPGGQGELVLYLAIQQDKSDLWPQELSEELIDNVLQPRLDVIWVGQDFRRRFIDLRATHGQDRDSKDISLNAEPKDFQQCLSPIPEDAFHGSEKWCSMRHVQSEQEGKEALELVVLDNRQAKKSGYEYVSSMRCKVRPPRGWNICNVNVPDNLQKYLATDKRLSAEELEKLQHGLKIEFSQDDTINKGSQRGSKPVAWTVVADDSAYQIIGAHDDGVAIEFDITLPTTIDFARLAEQQQSGLDRELFDNIANLDLLERFILGVTPEAKTVQLAWKCDKSVYLRLKRDRGDWIDEVLRSTDPNTGLGKAVHSTLGALSNSPMGRDPKTRSWLWLILLLGVLLLLGILGLILWMVWKGLNAWKKRRQEMESQNDRDDFYGGDDNSIEFGSKDYYQG